MSEETTVVEGVTPESDYSVLTSQQRLQIVENKLLQLEAQHFEAGLNAKLDLLDEEVATEQQVALDTQMTKLRELLDLLK